VAVATMVMHGAVVALVSIPVRFKELRPTRKSQMSMRMGVWMAVAVSPMPMQDAAARTAQPAEP
jgi:hypothetical protein